MPLRRVVLNCAGDWLYLLFEGQSKVLVTEKRIDSLTSISQ
jgi:hypothetical protein